MRFVAPVTSKVPAMPVLPVADLTVNLVVAISKSPSIPVAPVISTVLLNVAPSATVNQSSVVAPSTSNVPVTEPLPVTPKFPPTFAFLAIPTPPSTIKAPVVVLVD